MGIVNFYKMFQEYFPNSITEGYPSKFYENVAIDLNHWIHKYYCSDPIQLAEQCILYLSSFNCSTVIVAMDGACPEPKLEEQRKRRQFSSRLDISVGTDYMQSFTSELKSKLANVMKKKIYFSDYSRIGEGEHKICDILKQLKTPCLVITVDADFLILAIVNELENVDVLRQTRWYTHVVNIQSTLDRMMTVYNCNPLQFFLHTCLMGNDYLCKTNYKVKFPFQLHFFLPTTCSSDDNDENVDNDAKNWLIWLNWIFEYYTNCFIEWIPTCSLVKNVDYHDLLPLLTNSSTILKCQRRKQIQTIEHQLIYTFPNSKFLPNYLKEYFEQDTILNSEIALAFFKFWHVLFDQDVKKKKWLLVSRQLRSK